MRDNTITPSRLQEFCNTIIMQAREVLYEREDDILKAWHENIEEAQQSDKKFPPLKLSLGATVNLEDSTIETTLRFTAVYQSSITAEIPDPNQPELSAVVAAVKKMKKDLAKDGASVVIVTNGETVYDSANDEDGPRIVDVDEDEEPLVGKKLTAPAKATKSQPEAATDY